MKEREQLIKMGEYELVGELGQRCTLAPHREQHLIGPFILENAYPRVSIRQDR